MKIKKLIVAVLIFSATLIIANFTNTVKAEGVGLGNVTVTEQREEGGVNYKHQLYTGTNAINVWKLVTCTENRTPFTKTDLYYKPDIYCLRAGLGFSTSSNNSKVVNYSQSYRMFEAEDYERLSESEKSNYKTLSDGYGEYIYVFNNANASKFNSVMWILDNMLLEGATDAEVKSYLQTYAGYDENTEYNAGEVLSRNDIEVLQQLAIWYYTNNDEASYNTNAYNQSAAVEDALTSIYMSVNNDEYKTYNNRYDDLDNYEDYGARRQAHASTLYTNLINRANQEGNKTENINNKDNIFMPKKRDITIYLAGTNAATEQPIVRVEEKGEVDVALRKFISAVNGIKLEGENSRAPIVDTSKLNKVIDEELQTTAIYNHSKKPVKVSIGDTVTYTLRIYNEGEVAVHINKVTDYLPEYLQYTPYGDDIGNRWELDDETGRIATSTDYAIVTGASENLTDKKGQNLKDVLIPAAVYNAETMDYTLSYVDIEISCQVMTTAKYDKNITNIAQVADMTNESGTSVNQRDRDSIPNYTNSAEDGFTLPEDSKLPDYTGGTNGKNDPNYDGSNSVNDGKYYPGQEDDDDFDKVYVETPVLDLSLRKFISAVGDKKLTGDDSREPVVDTTPLKQGQDTAIYNHSKKPLQVEVGDVVTYTLRIYNEGDVNARVDQVKDHLAKNLKYVPFGLDTDENAAWWTETEGEKYNTLTSTDKIFVMNVGGNTDINFKGVELEYVVIPAYDKVNDVLSYVDIEVHCQVLPVEVTTKVTNIAEISSMTDEYGNPLDEDRDSKPDGKKPDNPTDIPDDLPGYKDDEIDKPYVPGQEDDDDFEKVIVIVPKVDLALRKYISAVDGEKLTAGNSREPVVNTAPLDNKTDTTAEYVHSKKPLTVKKGSLVTYTIRVYNEGEVNAYASKITDYLPNYLTYLPENETNKKYDWKYDEKTREISTTIAAKDNAKGDTVYASRENGKLLLKYDGNGKLNYIDVEVVCKVDDNALGNRVLTNLAQITIVHNEDGKQIKDINDETDSNPDGGFNLPDEKDKPTYKDNESNKPYVPGQEDDDDFEKVLVKPDFDLALRKFITKVGVTNVNNRYPEVSYEDEKLSYNHTKEPVELVTGDVVIYTIRVFNEGEADGYANEITDDVPEGLEFLPDNDTNKEYRWVMLDENQEVTEDVTKAKYIITDYLSEAQEKETERTNIIKAFDKEAEVTETNPDYKDVKIAFKVTYTAKTKEESARVITNTAQISKDSDDDIDSKPNRDEVYNHEGDNEDDIDFDRVKVKYFDLSLLKWVSQTKVTLNGKTTVTDTGHTAETSKNEAPVKLEVKEKDIKKINIKYVYTIRITNEGEIEGYDKEITDYIPNGLKFEQDDNPDWYEIRDGVIGTRALENTLLKPGESAEVQVILTWINGKDNFGEKINVAEISIDENVPGVPDIDSTPNNEVPDEDDIDDAPVIITVKTGSEQIYVGLILIILVTFAGGVGLIKKYVLE